MAQKANHAATDGSVAVIVLPGATVALVDLARVAIVDPGPVALVVLDPVATVAPGLRVAQVATADLALKGAWWRSGHRLGSQGWTSARRSWPWPPSSGFPS